jgi:hypothetical protein
MALEAVFGKDRAYLVLEELHVLGGELLFRSGLA